MVRVWDDMKAPALKVSADADAGAGADAGGVLDSRLLSLIMKKT